MPELEYLTVEHLSIKELARFFTLVQVDRASGCWNWIGELNHAGYGKFFLRGKKVKSHRLMYAWLIEPLPRGGPGKPELDHLVCDNHRCCNPCHLRLVPHSENMLRARREFCHKGHSLANARVLDRTGVGRWVERICRLCEQQRSAAWRARRKSNGG